MILNSACLDSPDWGRFALKQKGIAFTSLYQTFCGIIVSAALMMNKKYTIFYKIVGNVLQTVKPVLS